ETDLEARRASYIRGREHAFRAMAHNPAWRRAHDEGARGKRHMALLTADDSPAGYWAAGNSGPLRNPGGLLPAALGISTIRTMMNVAAVATPRYYGNAPDRFDIAYWSSLPRIAGRSAAKTKAAYERAAEGSPDCLANPVLYAFYYARATRDRALFERVL